MKGITCPLQPICLAACMEFWKRSDHKSPNGLLVGKRWSGGVWFGFLKPQTICTSTFATVRRGRKVLPVMFPFVSYAHLSQVYLCRTLWLKTWSLCFETSKKSYRTNSTSIYLSNLAISSSFVLNSSFLLHFTRESNYGSENIFKNVKWIQHLLYSSPVK